MRPGWGVSNSRAELDTSTLAGSHETHLLTTTTLGHLRQWYILLQVILCILGIPGTITHLQPWGRLTRVPDPPTHLTYPSNQSWTDGKPPWADVATDVYMWCLAWDIALKGHIPFASCYFAEIVLLNWAFLPDLKDASKSTCSIMMHQRTAVHFSLTQRRNNTQSRGDLWVSSLMYSKVATKLKSREVANYVSSVTTMNQLKKCWVSYLRRFSPIVRHHICCLDLVYWLQRKASLKHVHKHILMNFRNNLHFLWLNFADIYLPQGLNLPWGQYIKFKGSFVTCFIWWQLRLNFLHL